VPQDIPLEASEMLVFTPDAFAGIDNAPTFTLRTPTPRDKRFQRRLLNEEGAVQHSRDAMRAEMLRGLKALWGEDQFAEHSPKLEEFWQATDDFALQVKDDPDLVWEYDTALERACLQLEDDVAQAWRPLARMKAGNAWAGEANALSLVAVSVKSWTGLDVTFAPDRGYLSVDTATEIRDALLSLSVKVGVKEPGAAWSQLFLAALKRMYLDADTEGNSASASPSETAPASSKPRRASGKSRASVSSSKTLEPA